MSLISLQHVSKIYGTGEAQVTALRHVDLEINRGEYIAILGQSGSGKSTLLHILGLLDTPTDGSYLFDGKSVEQMTDGQRAVMRNEQIGFVFQQFFLIPRASVLENVRLPMIYSGTGSNGERNKRAKDALIKLGLGARLKHKPNQLSGGERQRVAIARALVNRPSVVFADEPTGNLDSVNGKKIIEILRELHQAGITIVLVTHEERLAREANRIIRVHDGEIEAERSMPASDAHVHSGEGTT